MEELSQNQLAPLIEKRLAELQNLLFTKKKTYEKAPQGRIRISQNGGHPEYYLVTERGSLRGKYLPHSQKTLARQLAQKDYDARLIKLLQKEISALQNYMKQTCNGRAIPELYDSLCPARRSLITPAILTNEQYAARWQDVSWTGRPFASDAPYICTARGERVRSKSEVIIADTLFRYNIPYRYEFPITLKRSNSDDIRRDLGRSITLYPDFLCLNTRTRTEFYWEHFGLMDDPDYLERTLVKLKDFAENKILSGKNLLFTMESTA